MLEPDRYPEGKSNFVLYGRLQSSCGYEIGAHLAIPGLVGVVRSLRHGRYNYRLVVGVVESSKVC